MGASRSSKHNNPKGFGEQAEKQAVGCFRPYSSRGEATKLNPIPDILLLRKPHSLTCQRVRRFWCNFLHVTLPVNIDNRAKSPQNRSVSGFATRIRANSSLSRLGSRTRQSIKSTVPRTFCKPRNVSSSGRVSHNACGQRFCSADEIEASEVTKTCLRWKRCRNW